MQTVTAGAAQLYVLVVYKNQSSQVTRPVHHLCAGMSDVGRWLLGIACFPGDIRPVSPESAAVCSAEDLFCNCRSDNCCDCVDTVTSCTCPARNSSGIFEEPCRLRAS